MKIVKVQAPDGSVIKVEGPDDAPDSDFIEQGAILYEQQRGIKETQAAKFPSSPTGGIVEPKPTGALEQIKTMSRRVAENVGIDPSEGILKNLQKFEPSQLAVRTAKDAFNALRSPVQTASGIIESIAGGPPKMLQAVQERDPEKFAVGATDTIMNTLPALYGGVKSAGAMTPSPETLARGARVAREAVAKTPSVGLPTSATGMGVAALKTATGPVVRAGANVAERLARRMRGDNPRPLTMLEIEAARRAETARISNLEQLPREMPSATVGVERPGVSPVNQSFLDDARTSSAARQRHAAIIASQQDEASRMASIETPAREFADTPISLAPPRVSAANQQFLDDLRGAPGKSPASNLAAIEEAIAPSGMKARKLTQLVDGKGNATKFGNDLTRLAPELADATKETVPGILKKRLTEMESGIERAESAIPPQTPIIAEPIADRIAAIMEDFAGDERSVAQLNREWERWAGQRSVPWEEFRTIKRNVGKNLTSPALRRAYRVLVEASAEISDELRIANGNYSVIRRAMDNGGIDVNTGRRTSTVGKPSVFDQMKSRR